MVGTEGGVDLAYLVCVPGFIRLYRVSFSTCHFVPVSGTRSVVGQSLCLKMRSLEDSEAAQRASAPTRPVAWGRWVWAAASTGGPRVLTEVGPALQVIWEVGYPKNSLLPLMII